MIECDELNTGETVGNAVVPLGTFDRRCLAIGADVELSRLPIHSVFLSLKRVFSMKVTTVSFGILSIT